MPQLEWDFGRHLRRASGCDVCSKSCMGCQSSEVELVEVRLSYGELVEVHYEADDEGPEEPVGDSHE